MLFKKSKPKIFCIGFNKTGSTSLTKFFKDHGYIVGDQIKAELLIDDYIKRNWEPILKYCRTAQVFQDVPFSNDYLYVLLDHYFPNSKFILSERSSSEEWYRSISKFHTKLFGENGNVPTKENLNQASYRYKGYMWKSFYEKYGERSDDIYNKDHLMDVYSRRNKQIKHYFKDNSNFFVLNVSDTDAVKSLSKFLNINPTYTNFPWENKTES